jgi:hypothetical protein
MTCAGQKWAAKAVFPESNPVPGHKKLRKDF